METGDTPPDERIERSDVGPRTAGELLAPLLGGARRRSFARGEVVFHEGDPGDTLHVIDRGRFAVKVTNEQGEVAVLAILPPGDLFGELAMLRDDAVRTATIVSLEEGETRSLARDQLAEMRRTHPEVTDLLLTIVADKVARYTGQLIEALYLPVERRVIRRLIEVTQVYGGVHVPVTQLDLAGLAGTSRATVNRVLRQEAARGHVALHRGRIEVLDRAALETRA